jgi:hypothetical protein
MYIQNQKLQISYATFWLPFKSIEETKSEMTRPGQLTIRRLTIFIEIFVLTRNR